MSAFGGRGGGRRRGRGRGGGGGDDERSGRGGRGGGGQSPAGFYPGGGFGGGQQSPAEFYPGDGSGQYSLFGFGGYGSGVFGGYGGQRSPAGSYPGGGLGGGQSPAGSYSGGGFGGGQRSPEGFYPRDGAGFVSRTNGYGTLGRNQGVPRGPRQSIMPVRAGGYGPRRGRGAPAMRRGGTSGARRQTGVAPRDTTDMQVSRIMNLYTSYMARCQSFGRLKSRNSIARQLLSAAGHPVPPLNATTTASQPDGLTTDSVSEEVSRSEEPEVARVRQGNANAAEKARVERMNAEAEKQRQALLAKQASDAAMQEKADEEADDAFDEEFGMKFDLDFGDGGNA